MKNSLTIKLELKNNEISDKEFKQWLDVIPLLSAKQFDVLCNDVFAETMEREQTDIMDPPSFDDDISWDNSL